MKYFDDLAGLDVECVPGNRGSKCLNCGRNYWAHSGWKCPTSNSLNTYFSQLGPTERYFTAEMKASLYHPLPLPLDFALITPVTPKDAPQPKDMSDWRNWAHNRPGDCPCGIVRSRCSYHKD